MDQYILTLKRGMNRTDMTNAILAHAKHIAEGEAVGIDAALTKLGHCDADRKKDFFYGTILGIYICLLGQADGKINIEVGG